MIRGERAVELRSPCAGPSIASLWLESKETARPKSGREEMLSASPQALERKLAPTATLGALSYALRSTCCELRGLSPAAHDSVCQLRAGMKRRLPQEARADLAFSDAALHTPSLSLCSLEPAADTHKKLTLTVSDDAYQPPRSIRWWDDVSCWRLWLLSCIQGYRPHLSLSTDGPKHGMIMGVSRTEGGGRYGAENASLCLHAKQISDVENAAPS